MIRTDRAARISLTVVAATGVVIAGLLTPQLAGAAPLAPAVSAPAAAAASSSGPSTVLRTAAKPKPKKYANCTAINKVYPHGVGKKGAKDKVRGSTKRVTNFTVDSATYKLNSKSDRDKDGIACEKR
ncbi:excalibur calcium-binding domain-containing protein [Homoserinibacter sp. YIM 151385]|uniref:excalibur calcium-binding domain-containing protein n=1 Tax=Homoserinibacter sp. YIM 151385 TaxID=2985506 RepID=UPI0022F05B66|nr:excalibur calcium-binding domain-containing protein [Homoserinibacter sp. YIM 151385]WBU38105.1 excalibur calcium-binding domain-containing protein [Homoserinibacter sp. YIM 151385]